MEKNNKYLKILDDMIANGEMDKYGRLKGHSKFNQEKEDE